MPASARGFALFTQQNIGQFRKGLELYYKWYSSVTKTRWKQELVRFSYDEKSANVVTWEDKERKYICSAWNKQQQGACHSSLAKCQPKRINRVRCGNRSLFLAEFIGYLPLIWLVVCVSKSRLRSRYGAWGQWLWRVKSPRWQRSKRVHFGHTATYFGK